MDFVNTSTNIELLLAQELADFFFLCPERIVLLIKTF